jgi:hypothetical protein
LRLIASIELLILDKLDYNLHFFHADTIAPFNKRIHNKWAMASIVIVVICVQGEVDSRFKFILADEDSLKDVQRVCIQIF